MNLSFDRRSDLGNHPGTHALIVGVSSYPHLRGGAGPRAPDDLGFGQLTSAAISAFRFSQWLSDRADRLSVPLATCRLLLAPSELEVSIEPSLAHKESPCTLDAFLRAVTEWYRDANSQPANMTFLYLAGHGIERSNVEQLFLLQDFGNGFGPILRNAIDVNSIFNGMMPSRRNRGIARTQLYFLDTSRVRSQRLREFELMNATAVFDPELVAIDDRTAVTFAAASPGRAAYAVRGTPTFFNQALLECLNGGAGQLLDDEDQRWAVTVNSLASGLQERVAELSEAAGVEQRVVVGGAIRETVIHYLDSVPLVDVTIGIDPPEAAKFARISVDSVESSDRFSQIGPSAAVPWNVKIPAGFYFVRVDFAEEHVDFKDRQKLVALSPPATRLMIKVDG